MIGYLGPIGFLGPKDHWQAELEKCSKSGLIDRIETTLFIHNVDRDTALKIAQAARKTGRAIDSLANLHRYNADPNRYLDTIIRRRKAAKKSAARRTREAKKQKGAA